MPGPRVSHYESVAKLGEGGMGVVWKARDTELGRFVALKTLPAGVVTDARRERLLQEARTASALNHPNIVTVYDLVHDKDASYVVMEWIDGRTLDELIPAGGMRVTDALRVAAQVASALEAAHAAGIVHRDLKPTNIMVTSGGVVKVLDFGLAKLVERAPASGDDTTQVTRPHTEEGTILGTVAYMSPEQADGKSIDVRSDIFSFGSVFYEMLTGRRAFQGASRLGTAAAILHTEPPMVRDSVPDVPAEVDKLVARCLRKEPARRWQHASDLRVALEELKTESESGARPKEAAPALPPTMRPLRWAVGLGLAVVIAAGGFWAYRYATRPPPLAERDEVLLADFANTTGDAVFDGALKQALSASLRQSPYLTVVSGQRVDDALKQMGRKPDERVSGPVAREACERANVKALIAGSIAAVGTHYTIGLQALNCRSGETLADEQVEAPSKDEVLGALGDVATRMRGKLGESLASIERLDRPLRQATTSSLEALKAFSLAEEQNKRGGFKEAISFARQAIELDPNFAMAYATLGVNYSNLGQRDLAVQFHTKAFELRHLTTERERLKIEADYYSTVTRELDKASEAYRVATELYPWPDAFNNWAFLSRHLGQEEKAIDLYRNSIQLEARPLTLHNLALAYVSTNRFGDARATWQELEKRLDVAQPHLGLFRVAWIEGDTAEMERQVSWFKGRPDEYLGIARQAEVAASIGQFEKRRELERRANELRARQGGPGSFLTAAEFEAAVGNQRQASNLVALALKVSRSRANLLIAAQVSALVGSTAEAQRLLDDVSDPTDMWVPLPTFDRGVGVPIAKAALELSRHNPRGAIALLDAVTPIGSRGFVTDLRARALLEAGDGTGAVAAFQEVLNAKGRFVGLWRALAHLGLGRAQALMGDTAAARRSYEAFLAMWKNADPDIPVLIAAKQEYAQLR